MRPVPSFPEVLVRLLERHEAGASAAREQHLPPLWSPRGWTVVDVLAGGGHEYMVLRRQREPEHTRTELTPREREALQLVASCTSNKEIAHRMGISPSTVGVLLHRARRKRTY